MVELNVINGRIFFGGNLIEAGISIDNGKIIAISKGEFLPPANETLDISNLIVLPGFIDPHTHILDLIYSYREDFLSGTQAAASGGVTTILEMPLGIEGLSILEVFEKQLQVMDNKSIIDFGLIGAAGFSSIDSIKKLAKKGVSAFKTFMINPSEEEAELKDLAANDDYGLLRIFEKIGETNLVSCVHAENDTIIINEIQQLIEKGRTDFQAHSESRPPISEDEACQRAILLAKSTNTKLHLVHMSSKNAFSFIQNAKQDSDVTCEITPHHLFLTEEDGAGLGPWAKVDPPLRKKEHIFAAWQALNNGTIDMIASDHSPYSEDEKKVENSYFEVGSGTTGIETSFPLMIDAYNKKLLSLKRLVEVTSINSAKRFGIYPQKGTIALNADADLVIIDLKKEYEIKNENLFTKPKISLFNGWKIKGKILKTLVRGKIVYDDGFFPTKKGNGQFIKYNNL